MINAFGCEGQNLHRLTDTSVTALSGAIWIDLLDATQDEISQVKQATGMSIPTLAEVSEIEKLQPAREPGRCALSLNAAGPDIG